MYKILKFLINLVDLIGLKRWLKRFQFDSSALESSLVYRSVATWILICSRVISISSLIFKPVNINGLRIGDRLLCLCAHLSCVYYIRKIPSEYVHEI